MGKVIVMNVVTLDGVMQGPGRLDEDTRDGFAHGGWGTAYSDEAMVAKMGERMGENRAFLFGRRTYEQLLASWNARGGPFKDALNDTRKFVASSNPATSLDWPNSTLLHGDVPAAVADLRVSSTTNLVIMGSGVLIGSLMAADVIDEYLLMIAPLVLGTGRRLFPAGLQASLRLVDSVTTRTGVVMATYERAHGENPGGVPAHVSSTDPRLCGASISGGSGGLSRFQRRTYGGRRGRSGDDLDHRSGQPS